MASVREIYSNGIYHGLPTFPEEVENLSAIVTGANGISGNYMMRVLAQHPKRWSKIWCLSRRPPLLAEGLPATAEHIALDFMKSPEEIAATLKEKGVKADCVFFFSYIQPNPGEGKAIWSNAEELVKVNTGLLDNFLAALTSAAIKPKRFMLQTGAKNYGTHLGPPLYPCEESDPRVTLEPNFYYPQEDSLMKWCAETGCAWNVAMPAMILGAVPDAAMNAALPLAIYAAVQKHLGRALEYPCDINGWQSLMSVSSSMMNAYLEEWSVLTPAAANQRFNACDDSSTTWEKTWPRVAGWYGIEYKAPDAAGQYRERKTRFDPPPRGYGPPATVRFTYVYTEWCQQPQNVQAWAELKKAHGLSGKELNEMVQVFAFLDAWTTRPYSALFSMNKAKKLGWFGFTDTSESLLSVMEEFARIKMIPPIPKVEVKLD